MIHNRRIDTVGEEIKRQKEQRKWLDEFRKFHKLNTNTEAITKLIDNYKAWTDYTGKMFEYETIKKDNMLTPEEKHCIEIGLDLLKEQGCIAPSILFEKLSHLTLVTVIAEFDEVKPL